MKIDLHVHAKERSPCARDGEESQIRAAIAAGLDGLAFTDHHRLVDRVRMENLRQRFAPFKIFTGIEITADGEDWLVIGLFDPSLESDQWSYPDLLRLVREKNAFIALAHPFRRQHSISVDLAAYPPDGIEACSNNTPPHFEAEIREIARDLGLRPLQNSDAHWNAALGRYFNLLPDVLNGDRDLVKTLMTF